MNGPPPRDPRYQAGPSTPHPLRVNDALWADFARAAAARGWTAVEALRWLLEEFAMVARRDHGDTIEAAPEAPKATTAAAVKQARRRYLGGGR